MWSVRLIGLSSLSLGLTLLVIGEIVQRDLQFVMFNLQFVVRYGHYDLSLAIIPCILETANPALEIVLNKYVTFINLIRVRGSLRNLTSRGVIINTQLKHRDLIL